MSEYLFELLIYVVWMWVLQDWIVCDEFGLFVDELIEFYFDFLMCVFCNVNGVGVWCDICQFIFVEICIEIVCQVLDVVLLDLILCFGFDLVSWCWGDLYCVCYVYLVFGDLCGLFYLVNLIQFILGGFLIIVQVSGLGYGVNLWFNVCGVIYCGVYDLVDFDSLVFIVLIG